MSKFNLKFPDGRRRSIQGELTLGRGQAAEIKVDDPQVSRRHATIYLAQGALIIRDEGSANGTFVNEVRIQTPTGLQDGDRVRLGETTLTVQIEPDPAAMPAAAPAEPAASRKSSSRRWLPWAAVGCGLITLCLVITAAAAFLLPATDLGQRAGSLLGLGQEYSLEQALAEDAVDDRQELLAYLGRPDAFTISRVVVDGVPLRVESWRYYGFGLRVDFVDGEIAWTIDIEPVPEGTILAAWYDPMDFEVGMSQSEVQSLLVSTSPAGMTPESIDTSAGGPEFEGSSLLAGDQIMVGLDPSGLVYVETFALFPEQEGG